MSIDTVDWHYWSTLSTDTIDWHCRLTLLIDAVDWHCWLTLSTDTVDWHCRLTLLNDTVDWHCWMTLSTDTVEWHCRLTLLNDTAVWHYLNEIYLMISFSSSFVCNYIFFFNSFLLVEYIPLSLLGCLLNDIWLSVWCISDFNSVFWYHW